jgi:hypothetical protein
MAARTRHAVFAEVHAFHEALAAWLALGEPSALARIERALHPDLTLIGVDGSVTRRAELLARLTPRGGARPGLTIEIDELELRAGGDGWSLVSFRERHQVGESAEDRRTSALLVSDRAPEAGPRWLHVHETTAAPPDPAAPPAR